MQTVVLWNAANLGYLTVRAGAMPARDTLGAGARTLEGGPLGTIAIEGSQIILGPPLMFTKQNIDQFDF